jgi:hypothetical protein
MMSTVHNILFGLSNKEECGRLAMWQVQGRGACRVLVGRHEGKRPLGRLWRRWEESINMDLQEVGQKDMDKIDLTQVRDRWRALVNAVMNLWFP